MKRALPLQGSMQAVASIASGLCEPLEWMGNDDHQWIVRKKQSLLFVAHLEQQTTPFRRLFASRHCSQQSSTFITTTLTAMRTLGFFLCLILSSRTVHSTPLDETSVVMVTGAAGYLGSEVALALHRIYNPKQLILIDSLEGSTDDLNTMEFQRQRVFRILQEISTASFYRVDLRPAIPEYYDTSEVPVLDHIVKNHPEITHIFHAARSATDRTIIPRSKGLEKAGLMESMLEQIISWNRTDIPSFVYVSDIHVLGNDGETILPKNLPAAAAAVQELIAAKYYDQVGSTALRFSSIYGPWDRHSRVFELAENMNDEQTVPLDESYDLVYIDDAVDAVLSALQLKAPVGSIPITAGYRVTEEHLQKYIQNPKLEVTATIPNPPERAKKILGWEPIVSLSEGLRNTIDWQADRANPYSSRKSEHCDTYDSECWNGTPIFPCASECANEFHCKSTALDDVISFTQSLTCSTILYTVLLDPRAASIPSAFVRVSTQSKAFVEESPHCNIAFVSHNSPLYINNANTAQHGFWKMVPVAVTEETFEILSIVPKLSPGVFFHHSVKTAIYVDPDVLIDDINALLMTVTDSPTVLLTGRHMHDPVSRQRPTPPKTMVVNTARERAYRTMHIALLEHGIRLMPSELDTGIIVYGNLHDANVRLFRCDVLSEIVQWEPNIGDANSVAFMLSLHDLWSRVVAERSGKPIEWTTTKVRRRLEEVADEDVAVKAAAKTHEDGKETNDEKEVDTGDVKGNELIDIAVDEPKVVEERPVSNDDDNVEATNSEATAEHQHNGFGVVDAIEAVLGLKQQERTNENQEDDFVVDDDDHKKETPKYQPVKHDSDDDIVMGILSSTKQQYFARIASLESIGVYRLTEELLVQQDSAATI